MNSFIKINSESDVLSFFKQNVYPCLSFLKQIEFSFLFGKLIKNKSDRIKLIERVNQKMPWMECYSNILDEFKVNFKTISQEDGVCLIIWNGYKVIIPNKQQPYFMINVGDWGDEEEANANWQHIDGISGLAPDSPLHGVKRKDVCWVLDGVSYEDAYYHEVSEINPHVTDLDEILPCFVIPSRILKTPLSINNQLFVLYLDLMQKKEIPKIDLTTILDDLEQKDEIYQLAFTICCIMYLHDIYEANDMLNKGESFELMGDEPTAKSSYTAAMKSVHSLIDQDLALYTQMKYGVFTFGRYISSIVDADEVEAANKWAKDNQNKALYLLRAGATLEELNNPSILSYENILAENTHNQDDFKFQSKAQYRRFLRMPYSVAQKFMKLSNSNLCNGLNNTGDQAIRFDKGVLGRWHVGMRWLTHSQIKEEIDGDALNVALESAGILSNLIGKVADRQIGLGMDMFYLNALKIVDAQKKGDEGIYNYSIYDFEQEKSNIVDFLRSHKPRGEGYNIEELSVKTTLKSLNNKMEQWIDELNQIAVERLEKNPHLNAKFRNPLLKEFNIDECKFIPIANELELLVEGNEMNNCVSTFKEDIDCDCYVIFKAFLGEERATVGFSVDEEDIVVTLDQVVRHSNKKVSDRMFEIAEKAAIFLTEKFA